MIYSGRFLVKCSLPTSGKLEHKNVPSKQNHSVILYSVSEKGVRELPEDIYSLWKAMTRSPKASKAGETQRVAVQK